MNHKRGERTRYESRFGGGWLSAGQYLAENMCDRMARKSGETLSYRFWDLPGWKRVFLNQLRLANSLLKTYSATAIIRSLRTPRGKTVYSFGAKFLAGLVEAEQRKFERRCDEVTLSPVIATLPPRPIFTEKPTPLSKLRDFDA